ncbi:unnamed protein product [Vicia faba]|uniref:Uncharacterized protein n=1 Tax=Vicia faba TaxID=3906 RepID=A0AAV1A3Y2_VICFA|nr:unnamed protein product [Vicia faba]
MVLKATELDLDGLVFQQSNSHSRFTPRVVVKVMHIIASPAYLINNTHVWVFEKSVQHLKRFSRYKNLDVVRQAREYPPKYSHNVAGSFFASFFCIV